MRTFVSFQALPYHSPKHKQIPLQIDVALQRNLCYGVVPPHTKATEPSPFVYRLVREVLMPPAIIRFPTLRPSLPTGAGVHSSAPNTT